MLNTATEAPHRAKALWRKYKIRLEQYDEMFEKQAGVCAICNQPSDKVLHVDHDHRCCPGRYTCGNCLRGLLCANCNHGIGKFRDSEVLLGKAADYMRMYDPRPDWKSYYLDGAKWVATRADCKRRKVGAILVAEDNRVLSIGYNGTDPGKPGCLSGACPRGLMSYDEQPAFGSYSNCISRHAEHNALLNIPHCDVTSVDANDIWWLADQKATMFITDEPCGDCQRIMRSAGVHKAIWPKGGIEL